MSVAVPHAKTSPTFTVHPGGEEAAASMQAAWAEASWSKSTAQ